MTYNVIIEKQALKQLSKIPSPFYEKIVKVLQNLADNPRPIGYKKLKGRIGYRIRINDYRIIYLINDNVLTVYIINIDNRKDVYD